jgi:hypothetical protein
MISLEALPKIIDTTQLTSDLEGTLHYDHSQWIDMRLVSNVALQSGKMKNTLYFDTWMEKIVDFAASFSLNAKINIIHIIINYC